MSYLRTCPRCNDQSYEILKTHAFCVSCNYSPDLLVHTKKLSADLPIPSWATKATESKPNPIEEAFSEPIIGGAA